MPRRLGEAAGELDFRAIYAAPAERRGTKQASPPRFRVSWLTVLCPYLIWAPYGAVIRRFFTRRTKLTKRTSDLVISHFLVDFYRERERHFFFPVDF